MSLLDQLSELFSGAGSPEAPDTPHTEGVREVLLGRWSTRHTGEQRVVDGLLAQGFNVVGQVVDTTSAPKPAQPAPVETAPAVPPVVPDAAPVTTVVEVAQQAVMSAFREAA